jgi:hypothetical protein
VYAGTVGRVPRRDGEEHVDGWPVDAQAPENERHRQPRGCGEQRGHVDGAAVEHGDHDDRADVVNDSQREQE